MGNGERAPDFTIDYYKGDPNFIKIKPAKGSVDEQGPPWGLDKKEWRTDHITILLDGDDPCVIHGGRRYCW